METQQPKPQKQKPKWLIPTIIVVGIIFLGLGTWAGYNQWVKSKDIQKPSQEQQKDEFASWQKYRSEEYGFEFMYPQNFKITKDEVKIIYTGGQKWYQLELTDLSSAETPLISFEVNPDGYGPFFPDKRYKIEESTDGGIQIVNVLLEEKSENSDDGYTLILPNSIVAKNGNKYFTQFIFKEGAKDWELTFKEILSTFKFFELTDTNLITTPLSGGKIVENKTKYDITLKRKSEELASFDMPINPLNKDIIFLSTYEPLNETYSRIANRIYLYNLKTSELKEIYYEIAENNSPMAAGEARILETVGIDGSKIIVLYDDTINSPGPCTSIWYDYKDRMGYLELADIRAGLKSYTVPTYKVEEGRNDEEKCLKELNEI